MSSATPPPPSSAQLLGDLSRLASELRTNLSQQREAAALPTVMDGLRSLRDKLDGLQPQVAAQEAELSRLRALASTAEVVNSSLELNTVLAEVMDTIIRLTGAERGFLMLKDAHGQLQFRVARGMERDSLDQSDFKVSRTIVNSVAESGQPVVTTNAAADPRFSAQESVIGYNLRSIVCVPMKFKGLVTGVIYVDNRIRTALFSEKERDLLSAFSNQAAIAIENARQYQQVLELKDLLDNVFASIASGVITTDVGDTITLCNRAAEQILDLPRSAIEGQRLGQAMPVDEPLAAVVARVKADQRPMVGHELSPVLPQRGAVTWSLNVAPLRERGLGQDGLAIVVDDVTEKKRLQNKYEVFTRMVPPQVVERLDVGSLQLGGVRRQLTIIFADIQGFTSLSETLDPEIVIEHLNRYVGTAAEAMLLQEATVDKYIGDSVMAFFNAPHDQPDHVLRALRAAVQMRDDIRELRETMEPQFRLNFRIAVHTGEAVVGLVGTPDRLDYTIIGDTVNTAKRIQENGAPGAVTISQDVYQAARDLAIARPLEPMHLKGKAQPVTVFELDGLQV